MITKNKSNNYDAESIQNVIDELKKNGIKIIYKPIALYPTIHSSGMLDYEELDIYDAHNKIKYKDLDRINNQQS